MDDYVFTPDPVAGALREYAKRETAMKAREQRRQEERFFPYQKPMVYVAGPISTGDWLANCREGIMVADIMRDNGLTPISPHACAVAWGLMTSYTDEQWLDYDAQLILGCDYLYRMEGQSAGADWEVEFAELNGISIYFATEFLSVEDFCVKIIELQMAIA